MNSERRAKLILRTAAVVAMLQAATHFILFLRSQPNPGDPLWPMVEAMQAQIVGSTNYWRMYFGYGLRDALGEALIAVLIMLAANFESLSRRERRRLVAVLISAVTLYAILAGLYFFRLPLIFYFVVIVLLSSGWIALREAREVPNEIVTNRTG